MIGLVFTKKVALAIVVCFTAKTKVTKWRLRTEPEAATSIKSRLLRSSKLRLADARRIMARAAIRTRKNVSDIAEASVANLMKIALEAKKNEATRRAVIPFDVNKQGTLTN